VTWTESYKQDPLSAAGLKQTRSMSVFSDANTCSLKAYSSTNLEGGRLPGHDFEDHDRDRVDRCWRPPQSTTPMVKTLAESEVWLCDR